MTEGVAMAEAAARTSGVPAPTVIGGTRRLAPPSAPDGGRGGTRSVRMALLDDHEVLLESMATWFRVNAPDFEVALTATTWLQLVHSPVFPTDLVFIDVQLREPVSIEARVRTCRAAGAKVIVLTGLDTADVRERAMRAGASAFLPKARPLTDVLEVARDVMGIGGGGAAKRDWRPLPAAAVAESLVRPRLSLGEEEALKHYVAGKSTNEVAIAMHVQFETAKTYLRRVREKYVKAGRPASKRADLMRRAAEDGYLD